MMKVEGFNCRWEKKKFQVGTEGKEFAMEPGPVYGERWCVHLRLDFEGEEQGSGHKRKR